MSFLSLDECVNKFIHSRSKCPTAKDRKTAENLLNKLLEHKYLKDKRDSTTFDPDYYYWAVKETVSSYSNSKDTAISILKSFSQIVSEQTNTDVSGIRWPEIPVSSSFERLMFIAKYLQDPKHKIEDLHDLLWVGERTIEADLAKLRGNDDDPIQICGRKFIIENTDRSDGTLLFKSTVHPFFLTYNLTQVIVILEGLRKQAEDPFMAGYAENAACDIWEQLSQYGKDRIRFVLSNLMPGDLSWIDRLNQMQYSNRGRFIPETLCSKTEGAGSMLECLKNELPAYIEYNGTDGVEFIEEAQVLKMTENGFLVLVNGIETELNSKRILRSAIRKEMLI